MTAAIVSLGRVDNGVEQVLLENFTGTEIVEHLDACRAAAIVVLQLPQTPSAHIASFGRAIAGILAAYPDLQAGNPL